MSIAFAQPLRPGVTLAERYKLVRQIGRGGMGSVWEVVHARLGRQFALKVMSDELMGDGQALLRFRREADLIASLRHPNIIEIVDLVDLDNGIPCIVMEYLDGEDLSTRISRMGALDWPTIAMVGEQILSALSVTHAQGIVHRDLKPRNIFIPCDPTGREYSKLLDFGLSKSLSLDSLTVSSTSGIGTPAYMAPEQADGNLGKIGASADVWAMGVVVFEMATGRLPFLGNSAVATLYQICHGKPLSLRELRPDAPAAFVEAVGGALTRNIDERWPSVDVFREQLSKSLASLAEVTQTGRHLESSPSIAARPSATRGRVRDRDTSALMDTMLHPGPPSHAQTASATDILAAPRRRVPRAAVVFAGAIALALSGLLLLKDSKSSTSSTRVPASEPAASAPADSVAPPQMATSTQVDAQVPPSPEGEAEFPLESASVTPPNQETQAEPPLPSAKKANTRTRKKAIKATPKEKAPSTTRERGKPINPF